MLTPLACDFETWPIRPGLQAPPPIALGWYDHNAVKQGRRTQHFGIVREHGISRFFREIVFTRPTVWVNVWFDLGVAGCHDPSLIPGIFALLETDLVWDVGLDQKQLDAAHGNYRGVGIDPISGDRFSLRSGKNGPGAYSAVMLRRRADGHRLDQTLKGYTSEGKPIYGKSETQTSYGRVAHLPTSQWPRRFVDYLFEDCRTNAVVWDWQRRTYENHILGWRGENNRAAWALHLMRMWGVRTLPAEVERIRKMMLDRRYELEAQLHAAGLVTDKGKRNDIRAREIAHDAYIHHLKVNPDPHRTPELYTATGLLRLDRETFKRLIPHVPMFAALEDYKKCQKFEGEILPWLERGTKEPIHAFFDPVVSSNRTACYHPNLQNQQESYRNAYGSRPGWALVIADWSGAELHTHAQNCIERFGYSRLADALNAGQDVHLLFAATEVIADWLAVRIRSRNVAALIDDDTLYEEARKIRKYKGADQELLVAQKKVDEARKLSKAFNFGAPGGLGFVAFVAYAYSTFGVKITIDRAKVLKPRWLARFPENREHLALAGRSVGRRGQRGTFTIPGTLFVRGGVTFTQFANGGFQGRTAAAYKRTLWRQAREQNCVGQYVARSGNAELAWETGCASALFGTRGWNAIHDEIIDEVPISRVHDAAERLVGLMQTTYNEFVPDVPIGKPEPYATLIWTKREKRVLCGDRLVPWHPRLEQENLLHVHRGETRIAPEFEYRIHQLGNAA